MIAERDTIPCAPPAMTLAPPVGERVYLLQDGPRFKVGYSRNVRSRAASHRTSNPTAVLVGTRVGGRGLEQQLHAELAPFRCSGAREWFELPPDRAAALVSWFRSAAAVDVLNSGSTRQRHMGERVQALRRSCGLSQVALARRADIGVMHLSKIERQGAIADPRISTVAKLAKALECSIDALVFGDE